MRDERKRAEATAYLAQNQVLRTAIGARADDVLTPEFLGVGEHNLNFSFCVPSSGRKLVLRINVTKQPFHDDQVAYEYAALQALASSGCTPEAVYLDNSATAPAKGALVIGFCEGGMLDFDHLRPGDLQCAAQLMADVHAVPVADDCSLFRPDDPMRELFDECVQRFNGYYSSAYEDSRITKWARRFMAAAEKTLDTAQPTIDRSHIVNTETLPSHFLVPAQSAADAAATLANKTGRFCENPGSFIDWERPVVGEVAQDVAYFTSPTTTYWDSEFMFPKGQVDALVEDYWRAVDGRFTRDGFDERFRAWRMMTALRSTTWCCRALVQYSRAGAHTTEKAKVKLPIYLSDEFMRTIAEDCFGR